VVKDNNFAQGLGPCPDYSRDTTETTKSVKHKTFMFQQILTLGTITNLGKYYTIMVDEVDCSKN
jgi:hypothetical protein